MISNQLNNVDGAHQETIALRQLGNRVKTLRIISGHLNYEKFAYSNATGRVLLRRVELGSNVSYRNLLKIIKALGVTPAEFFSEGMD